jgi:hypothetical protein
MVPQNVLNKMQFNFIKFSYEKSHGFFIALGCINRYFLY